MGEGRKGRRPHLSPPSPEELKVGKGERLGKRGGRVEEEVRFAKSLVPKGRDQLSINCSRPASANPTPRERKELPQTGCQRSGRPELSPSSSLFFTTADAAGVKFSEKKDGKRKKKRGGGRGSGEGGLEKADSADLFFFFLLFALPFFFFLSIGHCGGDFAGRRQRTRTSGRFVIQEPLSPISEDVLNCQTLPFVFTRLLTFQGDGLSRPKYEFPDFFP